MQFSNTRHHYLSSGIDERKNEGGRIVSYCFVKILTGCDFTFKMFDTTDESDAWIVMG